MQIYDGSQDKKVFPTKHTVAVVSAGRIVHGEKDHMTLRKNGREDWSLFYCEAGRLFFDDCPLAAGEIWIYPPRVPHKYMAFSGDGTVYRYVHFTGSDVDAVLKSLGICLRQPIGTKNSLLLKTLDNIQTAMREDSPLSRLTAEYHTLYLISQIADGKKQVSKAAGIKKAMDAMEHSFTGKYDAARYAALLGLSESRFNHLFKEQTGQSPYTFFVNLRIDNACALLEKTDAKIKEIAEQCGFDDPLYFTQAFRRLRGMTPSAYRRINRL